MHIFSSSKVHVKEKICRYRPLPLESRFDPLAVLEKRVKLFARAQFSPRTQFARTFFLVQ